jgi:signal transduction histidine kinase
VAPSVTRLPDLAATLVGVATGSLLAIWFFFPALKEFSGLTMKANTALGMITASVALAISNRRDTTNDVPWVRYGAGLVLLIGAATGIEYLGGINLGIDELLVRDFLNEESRRHPGRMSPITATCFCLLGIALLTIDTPTTKKGVHWTSVVTIPLLLAAMIAITGYVYGVSDFYRLGPYIRIALPSALCFLLLGAGTLMARPERGPIRYFANATLSGMAARRLLPAVVVMPLAVGYLRLWGQRTGLFGLELGTALFSVSIVVVLGIVVWIDARALDRTDRERAKSAQQELEALRLREEFLGVASHELKTPLTALLMQVQGVHRAMAGDPSLARYEPRLARAASSGLRLEKLINGLLDVSRLADGRLRLEPERFDLALLVEEVVDRFREIANPDHTPFVVRTATPVFGSWDRLRIDQVLSNLLDNALKYGGGAPIEVSVTRQDSIALVTVRDGGIGIPKDRQRRIFERFERSEGTRAFGGFGLGLWIVKEIVIASGGTIEVESREGAGACFTLRLPADD